MTLPTRPNTYNDDPEEEHTRTHILRLCHRLVEMRDTLTISTHFAYRTQTTPTSQVLYDHEFKYSLTKAQELLTQINDLWAELTKDKPDAHIHHS